MTPAYAEEAPAGTATVMRSRSGSRRGPYRNRRAPKAATHAGVFPPFDHTTYASQLLWLVITFVIFYLLMQKVIVPRIGGILESRHNRIAQDIDEAGRLKAEADAAVATYEGELAAPAPRQTRSALPLAMRQGKGRGDRARSRQAWPKS